MTAKRTPATSEDAVDELGLERETLAGRVGARLRERRAELGRTLRDVATGADVSVSYLSAVENGANVPSLPVLGRISHALELTIADVLRDESQSHVRRERLDAGRMGTTTLSHRQLQVDVRFVAMDADQVGRSPFKLPGPDVFVYVREGAVTVAVDGKEHELRVGDALDAAAPQRLSWRAGAEGAATVWAAGVPRDR